MQLKILEIIFGFIGLVSFFWGLGFFFKKEERGSVKAIWWIALPGVFLSLLNVLSLIYWNKSHLGPSISGLILYGLSLFIYWFSVSANWKNKLTVAFSEDTPKHLVKSGPYAYLRHPFYIAYSLFWLGGILVTENLYILIPTLFMLTIYHLAARMEEKKFLSSAFGEEYRGYMKRTLGI